MRESPATGGPETALIDLLGILTERGTYTRLLYLLVRFPLGVAVFTVFAAGVVLGVATLPFGIGVPILAGMLGLADHAMQVEAALVRRLLGRELYWQPRDATTDSPYTYLGAVLRTPRNYLFLAWFLVALVFGTVVFAGVTVTITAAAVLVVAPLTYWLPWVAYEMPVGLTSRVVDPTGPVRVMTVDSLPEAMLVAAVGLLLGAVTIVLCRLAATGTGRLLSGLLSQDR